MNLRGIAVSEFTPGVGHHGEQWMRSRALVCLLLSCAITLPVMAQEVDTALIRDEAPVVVTGTLPGPGMWKISRDGHVMHVLGTVSPLPKRMEWISRDVESVLAQAGEVVTAPSYVVDTDLGFFGKLSLLPSLLGVRRNPEGRLLRDVVPAESYARWLVLKKHYIGGDGGVEKMRPIFAASELYQAAVEDSGLTGKRIVSPVIDAAIKEHQIKRTDPKITTMLRNPKTVLKEFRSESLDDLGCFDSMLKNLESDVARMAERANAWAVGDIDALRNLPLGDQYQACQNALTQASVAQKNGLGNVEAEIREAWLSAAEAAIRNNAVSFAVLPMSELLESDGYLAALQAKGYVIEAP
jgi:hypothetical protein